MNDLVQSDELVQPDEFVQSDEIATITATCGTYLADADITLHTHRPFL